MRIKNLLAPALLAIPMIGLARPATPNPIDYINPDGSITEIHLYGDADFSYCTDLTGSTILEADAKGYLKPAMRLGRALRPVEQDIILLRSEAPAAPEEISGSTRAVSRMAALDRSGRTTYPTIGNIPALVVLLEFEATPYISEDPVKQFTRFCNEKGYSDYKAQGSAKDYFEACSGGKFSPEFKVVGPIRLQHDSSYYVGLDMENGNGKNSRFGVAIQEAVEALDPEIDFSIYDVDKDGLIDNIFFFWSGYGQADTFDRTLIWPHQSDYRRFTDGYSTGVGCPRLIVDGVEMATYACANELNGDSRIPPSERPCIDGIGGFVHEYGHVLGLPDFYDVNGSGVRTPGYYDVMANGSYNHMSTCPPIFTAYERWMCNWMEYTDVDYRNADDFKEYTLKSMTSDEPSALRIRIRKPGATLTYYPEYFLIEYRTPDSWDQYIPQHGMLAWRINYNRDNWSGNTVNTTIGALNRPNVEILKVDSSAGISAFPTEEGEYSYVRSEKGMFVPYCLGQPIDVTLSGMTRNDRTQTATLEFNARRQSDLTVLMHENPRVNSVDRTIHLLWDDIPEAKNYFVTVKYINENGAEKFLDGMNECWAEKQGGFVVRNIDRKLWNSTFRAYVRVYDGLPSSATSNIITFVPAEMEEDTGVDSITSEADVTICGGHGCIYAPEGTRFYNLSGVETGAENLPAGIYVAVYGGKTVKVLVK